MYQKIFQLPCSERVRKMREEYERHPVAMEKEPYKEQNWPLYYSGDRWMSPLFIEGWKKSKSEPTTILRRAKAEAYLLEHSRALIGEHELLVGLLDFQKLPDEEYAVFRKEAQSFKEFASIGSGRTDHICLDWEKLLRMGINGIIAEIEKKLVELTFNDPVTVAENIEKKEFYTGALIELRALLNLAERYAETALETAKTATPERSAELREIARIIRKVPANSASTFREALQSVHFYVFNLFGLYPGGRPDQYLLPFYEADMKSGKLTIELAQDLVDNYCLLFSTYVFTRAACSIMLAGTDSSGHPVSNAVTAHFLHSIPHVHRPDPNYAYAITPEPNQELLNYASKLISEGETHPSFYNDCGIVESLIAHGVSPADAHDYINTTCAEITICGRSKCWTTYPYVNCFAIFDQAVHSVKNVSSVDELITVFEKYLNDYMDREQDTTGLAYLERKRNGAEPLRVSCLIDDCIASGKTIWSGGARYNYQLPSFVGPSNVAEAISTINELVIKTREYSLEELVAIVDSNFKDNENLRMRIVNKLPHYGNNSNEVDSIMVKIMERIKRCCESRINYFGLKLLPGAFPYVLQVYWGYLPGADGRRAGMPLANCPGPLNGYDRNGPTSSLGSSSFWKQTDFLGGITMNLRFSRKQMSDAGPEAIATLIQGFFERNGMQLQINTVDREMLEDAMKNPENYGDLMVRIGGFSDKFINQTEAMQREIIDRTAFEV